MTITNLQKHVLSEAGARPLSRDDIARLIQSGIYAGRQEAFEYAAQCFDGCRPFNWVSADGYANGMNVAAELRYMAFEVAEWVKSERERIARTDENEGSEIEQWAGAA